MTHRPPQRLRRTAGEDLLQFLGLGRDKESIQLARIGLAFGLAVFQDRPGIAAPFVAGGIRRFGDPGLCELLDDSLDPSNKPNDQKYDKNGS
jgi:hypothetical protein